MGGVGGRRHGREPDATHYYSFPISPLLGAAWSHPIRACDKPFKIGPRSSRDCKLPGTKRPGIDELGNQEKIISIWPMKIDRFFLRTAKVFDMSAQEPYENPLRPRASLDFERRARLDW